MKDLIIKINDVIFIFAFVIFAIIGASAGYAAGGFGGMLLGIIFGALIGAMSSGFWFVLSGIYHNTKPSAKQ